MGKLPLTDTGVIFESGFGGSGMFSISTLPMA